MTAHFSVCLYCGSRPGDDPEFTQAAKSLGRELAARGHRLVYGAGDVGLMGEAARAAQESGGAVTGVIPQHLVDMEVGKSDLDEYIVTENMHERKMAMFNRADAVVALPGGPGTLDELIEVLTWRQLRLHAKPLIVINTNGYWNPLLALLRHTVDHGFADRSMLGFVSPVATPEAAVSKIEDALADRDQGVT
ncbi:MAG: TIGR00730 family Rossman fold protein [Pseudomonadota bacterium]